MKKGENPQFSSAWWKKNKAKTLLKTGISEALREWEIAYNGGNTDYPRALKALAGLDKAVANGLGKANKTLHGETIECLRKFPAAIAKKKKEVQQNYDAYQKNFMKAASEEKPVQKIGAPEVLWKGDLIREIAKDAKLKNIEVAGSAPFALKLNKDLVELLRKEKDRVSPAFMVEAAQKALDVAVKEAVKALEAADAKYPKVKPDSRDKLLEIAETAVRKAKRDAEAKIEGIPEACINDFKKRKQQYRDYQVKAGFDIAISSLQVVGGAIATGAAGAGTFGAGAVLGLVGLVRDCIGLANQIKNLAQEAETVGNALDTDLKALKKQYLDDVGKARRANMVAKEVTGTLLKSALGIDPPFLATIPKCSGKLELYDNKVAGLEVKGREYGSKVVDAIGKASSLEIELSRKTGKNGKKALTALAGAQKALQKSLENCEKINARVKNTKPKIDDFGDSLKALQNENTRFNEIFDKALPVFVSLGLGAASAGTGFAEAKTALDSANTALGLANTVLNEVKGGIEEAA